MRDREEINTPIPQESVVPIIQNPEIPFVVRPKKKWPVLVLVTVLFADLGVGGVLTYQKFFTKSAEFVQPALTATPTPVDETAKWRVTSESRVGVSFRYPEDVFPYTNAAQVSPDNSFFSLGVFSGKEKHSARTLSEGDLEL